jgi:hypothetical protein
LEEMAGQMAAPVEMALLTDLQNRMLRVEERVILAEARRSVMVAWQKMAAPVQEDCSSLLLAAI